ncbi:MAG: HlyD family efflux transporter periplasmic adaptor subunit [Gammaproteobacteria bacterium]
MQNFMETWLALQCKMITGASRGVLMVAVSGGQQGRQAAVWPGESSVPEQLSKIAGEVLLKQATVIRSADEEQSEARDMIAFPVTINGKSTAVIAVELTPRSEAQQRAVVQLLQWGSAWLELLMRQQPSAQMQRVSQALHLVALVIQQKDFRTAATVFTTELAQRYHCDQVSIGFCQGQKISIEGLAFSARFGKRNNLMRAIGSAMEEAWQQDKCISLPAAGGGADTSPLHAAMTAEPSVNAISSIPFANNGEVIGVLTLLRGNGVLEPEVIANCEHIMAIVGPLLDIRRLNDRSPGAHLSDSAGHFWQRLTGKGHAGLKSATVFSVLAAVLLWFSTGTYRVTADAVLEGSTQRSVTAAIDGYIAEVEARAGDSIHAGDLLATLDDSDLQLERVKLKSQLAQLQREQRSALASHDRTETRIVGAQVKQAEVQLQLVEARLQRTRLLAPIDGVIVAGDPSQSLGAPVGKGDVIYTIAPENAYRVVLQIDERDINELVLQQPGMLLLTGLSDQSLALSINKITPVANVHDGHNRFRVEARLEQQLKELRPGMEGVAKIDIAERRLLWIWTHRLTDWVRLKLWSWWP